MDVFKPYSSQTNKTKLLVINWVNSKEGEEQVKVEAESLKLNVT